MSNVAEDFNTSEYMRGQQDCMDGEECPEGASESYRRGFGAQYEWLEITGAQCERDERTI